MSPGVLRGRTWRVLLARRAEHGEYHPATFAAYGRARRVWRDAVRRPAFGDVRVFGFALRAHLERAFTVAELRAGGASGFDNRHDRKRKARRALVK